MSRQEKSETEIASLRVGIDALAAGLLALLNRRAELVRKVGELKDGKRVYRPERETEILRRVAAAKGGTMPAAGVTRYPRIISACARWSRRFVLLSGAEEPSRAGGAPHCGHAVAGGPPRPR